MLSGIISLFIIHAGNPELACYLSGAMFGISMSTVYPLILIFPIEAGEISNITPSAGSKWKDHKDTSEKPHWPTCTPLAHRLSKLAVSP